MGGVGGRGEVAEGEKSWWRWRIVVRGLEAQRRTGVRSMGWEGPVRRRDGRGERDERDVWEAEGGAELLTEPAVDGDALEEGGEEALGEEALGEEALCVGVVLV